MSLKLHERLKLIEEAGLLTDDESNTIVAALGFFVSAIDSSPPEFKAAALDSFLTLQLINVPDKEPTDYYNTAVVMNRDLASAPE